MKLASKNSLKSGFTLAESVIALGILVVLITGFLAVFGPAATAIRRTLSGEEASRMQSALEQELSQLREGQQFDSSLEKPSLGFLALMSREGVSLFTTTVQISRKFEATGAMQPAKMSLVLLVKIT